MDANDRQTVLIVDDDPAIRTLFRIVLAKAALNVTTAASAAEACLALASNPPDLILLDLHLAGVSGLDLAKQLIVLGGLSIPVVVVSASIDSALRQAAFQAGCSGFLSEPIHPPRFAEAVLSYLRSAPTLESSTASADKFRIVKQQFFQSALSSIDQLTKHNDEQLLSDPLLVSAAHRWIGACATIGLPAIEPVAREIEAVVRAKRPDQVGSVRNSLLWLRSEFEKAQQWI